MAKEIDPEVADYLYNEYTNIIKGLFKKLSKTYNSFIKKVIKNPKVLKNKEIPEVAPKLIPPGCHDKKEKKQNKDPEVCNEDEAPEETKSIPQDNEESKTTNESSAEVSSVPNPDEEDKETGEEIICTSSRTITESNKDMFEEEFEKLSKNSEQFSARVNLKNPGEVATKLLVEVNQYSCQLFSLWNDYIQL